MIAPQDFVSSANIYVWGLFGWGRGREEKTKTKSKRFIGKVVVLRHPSIVSWMFWLQRLLWLWSPTREWGVSATVGADKGWGRSIRWAFLWDRFRLSLPWVLRLERYDNSENFNWAKNMHKKIFLGPISTTLSSPVSVSFREERGGKRRREACVSFPNSDW